MKCPDCGATLYANGVCPNCDTVITEKKAIESQQTERAKQGIEMLTRAVDGLIKAVNDGLV